MPGMNTVFFLICAKATECLSVSSPSWKIEIDMNFPNEVLKESRRFSYRTGFTFLDFSVVALKV